MGSDRGGLYEERNSDVPAAYDLHETFPVVGFGLAEVIVEDVVCLISLLLFRGQHGIDVGADEIEQFAEGLPPFGICGLQVVVE